MPSTRLTLSILVVDMGWIAFLTVLYLLSKGAAMALATKPGVQLSTRPEIDYVRRVIDRVWTKYGMTPTITSGMEAESVHKTQIHYQGLAEDYRTHDIPTQQQKYKMFNEVRTILGADYDVIFEDEGKSNEHLHIEFDPS